MTVHTNIYAPEEPLIDRISGLGLALAEVGSVSHFAGYAETPTPSVYVMPSEYKSPYEVHDGETQVVKQHWIVAAIVAHTADDPDAVGFTSTAKTAGEILAPIAQSLVGWRPATGWQPFQLIECPEPIYDSGYGDFPVLFETGFVLMSN